MLEVLKNTEDERTTKHNEVAKLNRELVNRSPLLLAAASGNLNAVHHWLERCNVYARNKQGKNALHFALKNGRVAAALAILEYCKNFEEDGEVNGKFIGQQDTAGETIC